MKKVLYISYDGMTDPLGQSQVLPYIINLSKHGYSYKLVSFEKPDRFRDNEGVIKHLLKDKAVEWIPQKYNSRLPIASKLKDLKAMEKVCLEICKTSKIDFIHCRSYQAAYTARKIKKKLGIPYLFDMRGFWVDERVDGEIWNRKNPIYGAMYNYLKGVEKELIHDSDAIISLTEAGKAEIKTWEKYNNNKIFVIPCSADQNLFKIPSEVDKSKARKDLNINQSDYVISYLGSLGTWYMLEEMLLFFKQLKESKPNAKFLFITASPRETLDEKIVALGLNFDDFRVLSSPRSKVPYYLSASNFSIFFIKQAYSKIASSPTKLGELLSMGIPVVCNDKVGDVKEIIEKSKGGVVLSDFDEISYKKAIEEMDRVEQTNPNEIRHNIKEYYDLDEAIATYLSSYKTLVK